MTERRTGTRNARPPVDLMIVPRWRRVTVGWFFVAMAAVLVGLAIAGAARRSDPSLYVVAAGAILLLLPVGIVALRQAARLDGSVLTRRVLRQRTVDLALADAVTITPGGTGVAALLATRGATRIRLPMLAAARGDHLTAATCRDLADALARSGADGARDVAQALRLQADALGSVGRVRLTPFGRWAVRSSYRTVAGQPLLEAMRTLAR